MLISRTRQKLINAIIFFCERTQNCYEVKLYKLLYFLDFEHYRQTGRSVTGLDYFAWPKGPVPVDLRNEIEETPKPDFAAKIHTERRHLFGRQRVLVIDPTSCFDQSYFTDREIEIMRSLAREYKTANAGRMVEATHIPTSPWTRVYKVEKKPQAKIPYDYALSDGEKELIGQLASEYEEMLRNYQ